MPWSNSLDLFAFYSIPLWNYFIGNIASFLYIVYQSSDFHWWKFMEKEGVRFCNKRLICMCMEIPEPWGSEGVSASKQRPLRVVSQTVSVVAAARGVCVLHGNACQWDFASEHEMEIWMRGWEVRAEVAISLVWMLKIPTGLRFGCWGYQGSKPAAEAITGSWGRLLAIELDQLAALAGFSCIYILVHGATGRSDPRTTG